MKWTTTTTRMHVASERLFLMSSSQYQKRMKLIWKNQSTIDVRSSFDHEPQNLHHLVCMMMMTIQIGVIVETYMKRSTDYVRCLHLLSMRRWSVG